MDNLKGMDCFQNDEVADLIEEYLDKYPELDEDTEVEEVLDDYLEYTHDIDAYYFGETTVKKYKYVNLKYNIPTIQSRAGYSYLISYVKDETFNKKKKFLQNVEDVKEKLEVFVAVLVDPLKYIERMRKEGCTGLIYRLSDMMFEDDASDDLLENMMEIVEQ